MKNASLYERRWVVWVMLLAMRDESAPWRRRGRVGRECDTEDDRNMILQRQRARKKVVERKAKGAEGT